MSKEHTKTPWKHSGREIVTAYTGDGGRVIAIAAHGSISNAPVLDMGHDDWDLGMANLSFIVRAVNSHEALVDALKLLQGFDWRLDDSTHAQEIKRRALEALALADNDS